MFTNIGSKLKTTAKVLCWAGILLSAVFGVFMIIRGNELRQYSYTRETGLDMLVTGLRSLFSDRCFPGSGACSFLCSGIWRTG